MRELVMETMRTYHMYTEGGVILAAVSGGRDSMALLHLLHALSERMPFCLGAVHVNHGLRENAVDEQRLVEAYTKDLNIPLEIFDVCVPENKKTGESVEMAARRLRYAAFEKALKKYPGGTVLATAHHQKDQAETVLMRLLRGTGMRGLAGIHPVRGAFVRPMLFVSDEEIERYAAENAIVYRTDESNLDTDYTRNRIRHTLLPALKEQYNPNIERALGAMAKSAYEDEKYLSSLAWAQREFLDWQTLPNLAVYMHGEAFLAQPMPLQKRVIRLAMESLGFYHMEERILHTILTAIKTNGTVQVATDLFLRGGHFIQAYRVVKPSEDVTMLPADGAIRLGMFDVESRIVDGSNGSNDFWSVCINEEMTNSNLRVRTRRPGDRIAYDYGHKKLSDALIDNHIPFCIRDHLPVVLCGDEVVWAPGLRAADKLIPKEEHKRTLQIKVRPKPYDGGTRDV